MTEEAGLLMTCGFSATLPATETGLLPAVETALLPADETGLLPATDAVRLPVTEPGLLPALEPIAPAGSRISGTASDTGGLAETGGGGGGDCSMTRSTVGMTWASLGLGDRIAGGVAETSEAGGRDVGLAAGVVRLDRIDSAKDFVLLAGDADEPQTEERASPSLDELRVLMLAVSSIGDFPLLLDRPLELSLIALESSLDEAALEALPLIDASTGGGTAIEG